MFKDDSQPRPNASNPRQVWWYLAERWWVMALCTALAGTAALIYAMLSPRLYAATAVVKFESESPRALKPDGAGAEDYREEEQRKELQQLIQSHALLARVIARNNLAGNPQFAPAGQLLPAEKLTGRLRAMLRVAVRPGTRLIDITLENADPYLAAKLANSVVHELIQQDAEMYKAKSVSAAGFLGEEAHRLQQKLTECDTQLQAYKDQSLSSEQRQVVVNKSLNQQLSEAKVERIRLDSEYTLVKELAGNMAKLLAIPRISSDPAIVAFQANLAQQEMEFASVRQVYRERHPTYIQAEGKLVELQQALTGAVAKAVESMRYSYENALAREETLTKELAQQEQTVRDLNTQSVPYTTLVRDREQYRALYDAVIKRMGETAMAGNIETSRLQIFQSADIPNDPVRPRRLLILAGGVALGALLGVLINLSWMLWDDSIKTLSEAERVLQLPVLSTIPLIKSVDGDLTHSVVSSELPTAGAVSFRYLRTTLQLGDPEGQRRIFLFTSTLPGEGKTFCALNFAASLANQGLRTLLVDCDMQRPTLSKVLLGKSHPALGISDYLYGKRNETWATAIEHLLFCPAGNPRPDSSDLLAQRRLTGFLEHALTQFDRVVLDTAPIFGVSDTLLLVGDAHAVCLVVRAGSTSRTAVLRSIQTLRQAGATLSGVILNAIPESRIATAGNPYYDYGYKNSTT